MRAGSASLRDAGGPSSGKVYLLKGAGIEYAPCPGFALDVFDQARNFPIGFQHFRYRDLLILRLAYKSIA
jgi:hypothetical protein